MFQTLIIGFIAVLLAALAPAAAAQEPPRDYTCFQTGSGYSPEVDAASDVAIVYGVGGDFPERAKSWTDRGYAVSLMTGIAWGGYGDYFGSGDAFKKDEIQTRKNGSLFMHGDSKDIGYNVPTDGYIEYMQKYVEPAVDAGVLAIYLEEPEFWAECGWSEAFKREWAKFYGEPWQEPDSSVDAQYRASKLKYHLYFKALKGVFEHAVQRAAAQDRRLECHVPTHSLINYAQWRIVSPESHLIDIPELSGYIAQVWTGTARSRNMYCGAAKERTFEAGYLEYGQMLAMVRPTGRKVWFLADPVEDNPNHSWADYKTNYECTVIASLMWPEVHRYEVMPWPQRIFQGAYPKVDLEQKSGDRVGIPADYATELLTVFNALEDMNQTDVAADPGAQGVGVVVSDTLMFQRAAPTPSNALLGTFFGLAMPLVKHGVPMEVVQLENTLQPECLKTCKLMLLTYEGQKPLKRAYHEAIATWVRQGGGLIYFGDGSDPYHAVREWWNEEGKSGAKPTDDLFAQLGISEKARRAPERVGSGFVRVVEKNPSDLQRDKDGGEAVMGSVGEMMTALGADLKPKNYLRVQRGPYVVASVMNESVSEEPLVIKGKYVDLFDPALPIITEKQLAPNQRTLLYDLDWLRKHGPASKVIAAAARVKSETIKKNTFSFIARGPKATHANARVLLPKPPKKVCTTRDIPVQVQWDKESSTALISFDNQAEDLTFNITM